MTPTPTAALVEEAEKLNARRGAGSQGRDVAAVRGETKARAGVSPDDNRQPRNDQ